MATNTVGRKQYQLQALKYNMRSTLDFTLEGLYGPKAQLVENIPDREQPDGGVEDPSCEHHLHWTRAPEMVLFMKKFRDDEVTVKFKDMARWMIMEKGLTVCCEPAVMDEPLIISDDFKDVRDKLITWEDDTKTDCLDSIDLIVCIGGDGTLLYTSSMFQESIPPIISFNMGSLGFLTPFDTESYKVDITRVLEGRVSLTLRHRLVCEIDCSKTSANGTSNPSKTRHPSDSNRDCLLSPDSVKLRKPSKFPSKLVISTEDLKMKMLVLNDLVVDRGPSPYLTNLELCCNDRPMTSVQGDGVIIATPTGSTAYSLAAGASMVHPSVPCMVVTPICPHSLSFRSIVVPAGVKISLKVAEESRNPAWVAFDGRNRQEIMPGDSVVVNTSPWPIPSINNTGHVTDWFDSLAECLHWNVRKKQKELKPDKL